MIVSISEIKRIIRESIPPWLIDKLRRAEEERKERESEQGRRLPLYAPLPPDMPDDDEDEEKPRRGVEIVDLSIDNVTESTKLTRDSLKKMIIEEIVSIRNDEK